MSEKLKELLSRTLEEASCNEVDKVEMRRFSKFSYGVFNPEEENEF